MHFLREREPERDVALTVAPGVARVVAKNPSPMTYFGTNSYIIETGDGVAVLDPGPDDGRHVEALLAAAGGHIDRILLTHGHRDHTGAVARLAALSGAPVAGFAPSIDPNLCIDRPLKDGDRVGDLTVLHTPGHAADHLCYAMGRSLFTGDHVMAWSTSVVSPPGGDMVLYLANLRRLAGHKGDDIYLPGHGPMLEHPIPYVEALIAHRLERERAVLAALGPEPVTLEALGRTVYAEIDAKLRAAAERNLLGHLVKLATEGRARQVGTLWARA